MSGIILCGNMSPVNIGNVTHCLNETVSIIDGICHVEYIIATTNETYERYISDGPTIINASLILFIFEIIYVLGSLLLMFYFRRSIPRNISFSVCSGLGLILMGLCQFYRRYSNAATFPCGAIIFLPYMAIVLIAGPWVASLFLFKNHYELGLAQLKSSSDNNNHMNNFPSPTSAGSSQHGNNISSSRSLDEVVIDFDDTDTSLFACCRKLIGNRKLSDRIHSTGGVEQKSAPPSPANHGGKQPQSSTFSANSQNGYYKISNSPFFIVFVLAFLLSIASLFGFIRLLISPKVLPIHCVGCEIDQDFDNGEVNPVSVACVVFWVLFMWVYLALKNIPDPLRFRREVVVSFTLSFIFTFTGICLNRWLKGTDRLQYQFHVDVVIAVGILLAFTNQCTSWGVLSLWNKIKLDFLSNNNSSSSNRQSSNRPVSVALDQRTKEFRELWATPAGKAAFLKYLVSELSVENGLFLQKTEIWKANYPATSPERRFQLGYKIYEAFIPYSAKQMVNISSELRNELNNVFLPKDGTNSGVTLVPIETFNKARYEIEQILALGPFLRFKKTERYLALQTTTITPITP